MNLLDKAVLEIGAGTGLLSIVACLLGESISGVSDLSDMDQVLPHVSPNEQMPASQRDPALCLCSAERFLLISESRCLALSANVGSRAEPDMRTSLNPALTVLTLLSFTLDSANLSDIHVEAQEQLQNEESKSQGPGSVEANRRVSVPECRKLVLPPFYCSSMAI